MQKALPLLISALLICHASAAASIPHELVGEWIDNTNMSASDAIQIDADGGGAIYAWRNGDPRGAGIQCAYQPENHTLTVRTVIQPHEIDGKTFTYHFKYNPATQTLVNLKGDWEVNKPFWKRTEKFLIPDSTLSPDHKYGVTVPVFYSDDTNDLSNTLVEVKTGKVLATINAEVGYDCSLNFLEVGPTRWSKDSSILL